MRSTVEAARGRLPVLVGIAHSSPAESVAFGPARTRRAPTRWSPRRRSTSVQSVRAAGAFPLSWPRLDLPLITYDVPSAVKIKIAASTVRVLAEEGLIIGIKDSSGDLAGFRDMLIATRHCPTSTR